MEEREEIKIKTNKEEEKREKRNVKGGVGRVKLSESVPDKKEQDKFFIDVAQDQSARECINKLLVEANNKVLGRPIILKDLVLFALPKLTARDIEAIQHNSLTNMERIEKQRLEYNLKNKTNLDLGEYLVSIKNILKEGK